MVTEFMKLSDEFYSKQENQDSGKTWLSNLGDILENDYRQQTPA